MQKKLIALAVAGLMSSVAFAQTSVTISGKVDAGYQFKRTANTDAGEGQNATNAYKTTETLSDGGASTSRITFSAKETISPSLEAGVTADLRFSDFFDGKASNNSTTSTLSGIGGLTSNDKKAVYLKTPAGTLQWGTANLMSGDYKLAEKPYMVKPNDLEIVKHGIAQAREESLTNRNTSYWSPTINAGPVQFLFKGTLAIGDNQKGGSNDAMGVSSGNVWVIGTEFDVMSGIVDGGFDVTDVRPSSQQSGAAGLGRNFSHLYLNIRPIPGNKNFKIALQYNVYKGATGTDAYYKEKNTSYVLAYDFNGKGEIGIGKSNLRDLGSNRNSGRGLMIGGMYKLSKSTYVYAAMSKNDFERNTKETGGKYVGNAVAFTGDLNKVDDRYTRVGFVKEF